jgi:hypothetical protein
MTARRPIPPVVVPADFGELRMLVWNQDPHRPLPAQDAFAIYERNWRHVDVNRMTQDEAELVRSLADAFGHGVMPG